MAASRDGTITPGSMWCAYLHSSRNPKKWPSPSNMSSFITTIIQISNTNTKYIHVANTNTKYINIHTTWIQHSNIKLHRNYASSIHRNHASSIHTTSLTWHNQPHTSLHITTAPMLYKIITGVLEPPENTPQLSVYGVYHNSQPSLVSLPCNYNHRESDLYMILSVNLKRCDVSGLI